MKGCTYLDVQDPHRSVGRADGQFQAVLADVDRQDRAFVLGFQNVIAEIQRPDPQERVVAPGHAVPFVDRDRANGRTVFWKRLQTVTNSYKHTVTTSYNQLQTVHTVQTSPSVYLYRT